jgi:arylsulfatase A-like enzyme
MTGKWHLGVPEQHSPAARGFDQSYALVHGGSSHWSDGAGIVAADPAKPPKAIYRENGKEATLPKDFFSSDFFTSRLIDYIDAGKDTGKPFFAYLAFTAPHWPLHAHDADIAKYEQRYKDGYDTLRREAPRAHEEARPGGRRHAGVRRPPLWPKWDSLSAAEKASESKRMAVYAAMVDNMDQQHRPHARLPEEERSTRQHLHLLPVRQWRRRQLGL